MASCPTCKRAMPKPRKRKNPLTPLETLARALHTFAAFAIPAWPGEGIHYHPFYKPMEPAVMTCGFTREEIGGEQHGVHGA